MSQAVPEVLLPPGLTLGYMEGRLALAGDEREYGKPLSVDFVSGKAAHRRQFGGGRGQLVAKACGLAKGVTPSVVDATAGLGRDAFVLASLGAPVLMIERVAAIAALLSDGLARAAAAEDTAAIAARMYLRHGDAAERLARLVADAEFTPQVVHLDPMFPHRDKSALVKKEMRVFRELAGDDDDAPRLLEAALDVATHRVVVKRPRKAPPIAGPAPQHTLEGKTSRYDLYVHRSLSR
ncbi:MULTISPECIES: class I SAM-dependent methyltransferase [Halomonadaceae]|uniref:Ribosomal RNA small subunit methyltransferase J n=1 Tax=Vreelandella piezotolerans TaxID=2609667 RepID=A0ABQ6XCS0_9GAMM|nr:MULTISPECIES: class I SAM-dependent methyltransferase [Halomonas]KFC51145.1 ribosomal RNA small subunit methyltransferase J [Halomonas sp. SUBG004]KAE8439327.1 rRNA methyltransferase [Halomonas piezotolerans]MCG7575996.1 class I SAM-dependent methyltransferase [Halomonas sp. MMH1-48]MCG7591153.1 class I SAM-dependent methyltransferase [Halomonas sp. McD50-5]MCG7603225.1 class I SAM-dependent methyltransferase [Halomonas sp. MM17-34]